MRYKDRSRRFVIHESPNQDIGMREYQRSKTEQQISLGEEQEIFLEDRNHL